MKKLFYVCLSLIFFLSACGTSTTPPPTLVPTIGVTPTRVPTTGVTPTVIITETGAADTAGVSITPTIPGSSSGCTDAAVFVDDVTIPDYSHFDQHETFTKTWRIKNTGTCTWNSSYSAAYSSGDHLGVKDSVPLSDTAPGATLDISVDMAAPSSDGTYKVFYQLENTAGKAMTVDNGNTIWAIITVGKVLVYSTSTPAATPATSSAPGSTATGACVTQSNASFLSQTVDLINSARATNGLPALTLNDQLSNAAQTHSIDMACSGNLAHSGSDGSTPASRIAAAGFNASISRENIYAQPPQYGGNPQAAVDWWMSDQIHRDAILNVQVTQIGVGYAAYSASPLGGYFTVDFAAP